MGQIVFRRIGGRIVPIRSDNLSTSERKKAAVQGATAGVGAIAAAIGAGSAAAELVKKSHKFRVEGTKQFRAGKWALDHFKQGQMSFDDISAVSNAQKMIAKGRVKRFASKQLFKTRSSFLAAGAAVSTGLLALSAAKINEAATGKRNQNSEVVAKTAGAASIASGITAAAYYHRLPVGNFTRVLANVAARAQGKQRPFKAKWWK